MRDYDYDNQPENCCTILKLFLCSLKIDDEIESESVVTMQLTVDLSVSKKFYSKSF